MEKKEWSEQRPKGGELVEDPTAQPLPGFNSLTRKQWTSCNRIRARHGRTAVNLQRWGYSTSSACPACDANHQDMDHLILHCSETSVPGEYHTVHQADEASVDWLKEKRLEV
jgi:hypothetical protein